MKLLLVRHGETFANDAQRWSGALDLEITNFNLDQNRMLIHID